MAELEHCLQVPYCADSGADRTILSRKHFTELVKKLPSLKVDKLDGETVHLAAGNQPLRINEATYLRIKLKTAAGPVELPEPVEVLILEEDQDELLIGQDVLLALGIDVDRQLEQLSRPDEDDGDDPFETPELDMELNFNEIKEAVESMIARAIEAGFPRKYEERLRTICLMYDIWRVRLGPDPPAKVPPLSIRLKPDAQPRRCKARVYPPHISKFMRDFNAELVRLGWVRVNRHSRWASPALPVRKPKTDEYRQTTDYRGVNSDTEPIVGVMPHLQSRLQHTRGKKHYGSFDFLKGFWQLPLAEDSQEPLSYMTDENIFTPMRVPQGSCDAAVYFQLTMEECFKELLYTNLLVWIDDLLLYADDIETYLEKLEKLLFTANQYGLKLSASKTCLYQQKVSWCGRIISADGVRYSPDKIEALRALPYPTNAGELQQFLCAVNWMRDSIIDYARLAQPLQECLEKALRSKRKTKRVAAGISIELDAHERTVYDEIKAKIGQHATLSHPDDQATLCLFTDASDTGWGVIVTQVANFNPGVPVHEQTHELLVCMGGNFKGAQLHWSVIEKEAYPIVQACDKLAYLLQRPQGFRLYCDHRNLIHVFAPSATIKKHIKGKLLRWALKLMEFRYTIAHIDGPHNVWADMISRWGQSAPNRECRSRRVQTRSHRRTSEAAPSKIRPLDSNFNWPTIDEIAAEQDRHPRPADTKLHRGQHDLWCHSNRVWIPSGSSSLIQRLFIAAHCGSQGHRGRQATMMRLSQLFWIPNVSKRLTAFLSACLLCHHVKGGKVIPRPWSESYRATERNQALHWDFIQLGESFGQSRYLLVLKDDATHFCELVPCDSASSKVAIEAMLDWHSRYGAPRIWISDSGTHFKNEVVQELSRRLKARQDVIVAYSPWINGSVERVNRDILQVLKAMLLEYQLDIKDWPYLVPIVQANLNHTPVASLGNRAPIELFTGLPNRSPLEMVLQAGTKKELRVPKDPRNFNKYLERLRSTIRTLHKEMVEQRAKQLNRNKSNSKKAHEVNFHIGDYVLRSRVDSKHQNKLLVTWVGPYQVVGAAKYSFRVRHLLTGQEADVHPSRLKFFANSSFNVTEELREHIASQGIVLAVEELLDHRWHSEKKDYELKVRWKGLEEIEDSWESLSSLKVDIPVLVDKYVAITADKSFRAHWNRVYGNNS